MGFPRTPFLSVAEKMPPCRQAQEHRITGGGWALVKEFFGKAVLSMAAQDGLLHGAVQQTEKNFFQRRAGRENRQAETVYLQWVQSFAAQRGAVQNGGGALEQTDCSCEADGFMLT